MHLDSAQPKNLFQSSKPSLTPASTLPQLFLLRFLGMCKKQTSVPHSSTEVEIISLDAGLRMEGIPALDLWDLVIEVLHSSPRQPKKSKDRIQETSCVTHHQTSTLKIKPRVQSSTTLLNCVMVIMFRLWSTWCQHVQVCSRTTKCLVHQ